MNRQAVWAIARKDLRSISANLQVWLPMLLVPLLLGLVLPVAVMWAIMRFGVGSSDQIKPVMQMLDNLPASALRSSLEAMPTMEHRLVYLAANFLFAPLFLLIGLMASSVVSADSFAGEKERGTLESLLFTPADLLSLLVGKALAALLPAVALSLGTFLLFGTAVNLMGWPLFGSIFFPRLNWLPLMLLVIPMISLLSILLNLFISARVATFQAAYQMGGLIVLPVVAMLFGQVSGLLLLDTPLLTLLGGALTVVNAVFLRLVLLGLTRSRLFESQIR